MKYPCNLIRDLIPLHYDLVCSPESRDAVEEHLQECAECKAYYRQMHAAEVVEKMSYDRQAEIRNAASLKKLRRKIEWKGGMKVALVILALLLLIWIAVGLWFFGMSLVTRLLIEDMESAQVEYHTDIAEYEQYIGDTAKDHYLDKMNMDESIFPEEITEDMEILDYCMVYYNPWDRQYLSYLVACYGEQEYERELARLQAYESTEYLANYGVTGFSERYTLLAMNADPSYGFVYALTDGKGTIIYVELLFCNYFYDLEYMEYIPEEYLPVGFDATAGNAYREKMLHHR